MTRRAAVAALLAVGAGCTTIREPSEADAAFFRQFDRKVFPVAGSAMANLPPHRRAEIRLIQSVLKPHYRSRLEYTYSNEGIFVVFVSYGDERTGGSIAVNGCTTPTPPLPGCIHDCGLGFRTQDWSAAALMEIRCADDAPVWLHAQQALPQFERPATAAPPTP